MLSTTDHGLSGTLFAFPSSSKCVGTQSIAVISSVRQLSTRDIFFRDLPAELTSRIPDPPVPVPKPSLVEMISSGQSVLDELELWSWWKPSSWLRYGMEMAHLSLDLPWWATIIASTVLLRVVLCPLPIAMQKMTTKQQQYAPELLEFRERTQKAQREGNNALVMQVLWEQRDFMKQKGINVYEVFPLVLCNGLVFLSQFFALKRLAVSKYPGIESQGLFWFKDLSVGDPLWVLPLISATTMHFVFRFGLETGSMATQGTYVKYGMLYGVPLVILICANQFSSAVCLYWCTSNLMTLTYSYLFRIERVRKMLKMPPITQKEHRSAGMPSLRLSSIKEEWRKARSTASVPTLETLKRADLEQFRKAGRGKPVIPEKGSKE